MARWKHIGENLGGGEQLVHLIERGEESCGERRERKTKKKQMAGREKIKLSTEGGEDK